MIRVESETEDDWWEVEALYDLCFAPGREALSSYRLRDGVAPVAGLSLTARDSEGILAGAIRHWPVRIGRQAGQGAGGRAVGRAGDGSGDTPGVGTGDTPGDRSGHRANDRADDRADETPSDLAGAYSRGRAALLLGPVAVHPTRQGEGLGALLIQESLARGLECGWARVMLVGDRPYYSRFGFEVLDGVEMPPPTNPERVLGLDLRPGAWAGVRGLVERWTVPPNDRATTSTS